MMGMFDEVRFNCKNCNEPFTVQSKVGDCTLMSYYSHTVPIVIAEDIIGKIEICEKCGAENQLLVDGHIPTTVGIRII